MASSFLPTFDEMASSSKRNKNSFSEFRSSLEVVLNTKFEEIQSMQMLSEKEIQCWLVGKYGMAAINKFCEVLKHLPPG